MFCYPASTNQQTLKQLEIRNITAEASVGPSIIQQTFVMSEDRGKILALISLWTFKMLHLENTDKRMRPVNHIRIKALLFLSLRGSNALKS